MPIYTNEDLAHDDEFVLQSYWVKSISIVIEVRIGPWTKLLLVSDTGEEKETSQYFLKWDLSHVKFLLFCF